MENIVQQMILSQFYSRIMVSAMLKTIGSEM